MTFKRRFFMPAMLHHYINQATGDDDEFLNRKPGDDFLEIGHARSLDHGARFSYGRRDGTADDFGSGTVFRIGRVRGWPRIGRAR